MKIFKFEQQILEGCYCHPKISGEKKALINDVLNRLSDMNASQVSDYSHKDVPWLTTEDQGIIDYESVFYRTSPYSQRQD